MDEALLDVTASRSRFGDGAAIARRIQDDVRTATSLSVSVGVAACKFVAKVASDLKKLGGLVVAPAGGEAAFLAPLPVARLWGAGRETVEKLDRLGIKTIGDLASFPRMSLSRAIGAAGAEHFLAPAVGDDPREVVPDRDPLSIGCETTFAEDVAEDSELDRVLIELCESVGRRLRTKKKRAGVVRVKVSFPPFETHLRQERLPRASDEDLDLLRTASALVSKVRGSGRPVRFIGVTAASLEIEGDGGTPDRQLGLIDEPAVDPAGARRLTKAVDALRERFGDAVIRRAGGPFERDDPTP